jgi:ATP-dependent helicase HrpB
MSFYVKMDRSMNPERPALPIDPFLPEIQETLKNHSAFVLTAEPGAGKTTRVPPALLRSPWLVNKEIWVLQPRRIAAKMAAFRVAAELGEMPGQQVGYHFRFEKKIGSGTRLIFMTDGMLFPLAQADPSLSRVGVVILDEFHERSQALDLGLSWLKSLQASRRPDLKMMVMSATLDVEPLAAYLSGCPILKSPGRVFPVKVEYHPFPHQKELAQKVQSAVRLLVSRGLKGTFLVFLPGLAEIRRSLQALSGQGLEVVPLYGDLSLEEQQMALLPSRETKIILSTNLAETSLTVPGVTAVIDAGLNRQSRVSPWSGLESLVTVPASQASSVQRAGRAGRLQEGVCLRLYSQFDFEHRTPFDLPEISRCDLSRALLELLGLGVKDLEAFPWFLKPPPAALESAQLLLKELGTLNPAGELSDIGRRMARMPLPPRLAKFLLSVEDLSKDEPHALRLACRLAAFLQGGDSGSEDLLEEIKKPPKDFESNRLENQLAGLVNAGPEKTGALDNRSQTLLSQGLLTAFPDRVAKLRDSEGAKTRDRKGNQKELVLAEGGSVTAPDSALTRSHDLFLVIEAQEILQGSRKQAKARSLCPVEEDWLLDFFPESLSEEQAFQWNSQAQRVEGFKRLRYRQLVLDEKALGPGDFGPEARELLYREALAAGPPAYSDPEELEAFLNRLRFTGERMGEEIVSGDARVQETLKILCGNCRSFGDLRSAGLVQALRAGLPPQHLALVERLAPTSVLLPSGRRMAVHYEEGKPPWGESRIQDFFGMKTGPRVANGEVAVVLHLLSPAKRAMQVTSDLAGFWERQYPQLRKELSRRYPRHKWPENPLV